MEPGQKIAFGDRHPVELLQEIDMEHEPPEFTVGYPLQPDLLLLAHHLGDGLVFDLPQLFGPDLSLGTLRPGIHHCLGPKETAHVVCSERWPVAHVVSLVAVISERNARRPR